MGYNPSIRSVVKVENYLEEMLRSESDLEWTPPKDVTPFELSFRIREGIRAALGYPQYHKYAGLLSKWMIRQRPRSVKAELKLSKWEATKLEMGVINLDGPTDAVEVIGAAIKHKGQKMFFPNAAPSISLYNWCEKNGYNIIYSEDAGLTLTKESVGDLRWSPEIG